MKATLLTVLLIGTFLFSCDDDEPKLIIENEEELITTLTYTLTPVQGGDVKVLTFRDLDGDGANVPVITVDSLEKNTAYKGALTLLNESVNPAEDITVEIREEVEEHQFFFQTSSNLFNIAYADMDANGNPIGLATTLSTDSTSGNLTITLIHEPNKSGLGVSSGDITNAGGESDIQVTFAVNVKN